MYVVLKQLPAMQKTSVGQLRAVTLEPGAAEHVYVFSVSSQMPVAAFLWRQTVPEGAQPDAASGAHSSDAAPNWQESEVSWRQQARVTWAPSTTLAAGPSTQRAAPVTAQRPSLASVGHWSSH